MTLSLTCILEDLFSIDNKIKPHERLLVDAVVEFMKSKYNINAKITVRKSQNSKFTGYIPLSPSAFNNKFTLYFNSNQSYELIIKSLIHELTHIKQVYNKELQATSDYKNIIWKGKLSLSVNDYKKTMKNVNDYKKIPWEHEAYINQDKLYDEFINSKFWTQLKGSNPTLDFIIDTI